MYSQCPECLTIFKLEAAELAACAGQVRCGHCSSVFDALRSLAQDLPAEPIHELALHPLRDSPPPLGYSVFRPQRAGPMQSTMFAEPADRRRAPPRAPGFAARHGADRRPRRWPWLAATVALALVLAAQVGWSGRERWLREPGVRALAERGCARLGCRVPLQHDAALLRLLSRDIRAHPSVPDALLISATLHNSAPFAQAWPVVGITLSNLDEKPIAARRFQPREYLADPDAIAAGLPPGASSALVFEVVDPGQDAVAFEFRFDEGTD